LLDTVEKRRWYRWENKLTYCDGFSILQVLGGCLEAFFALQTYLISKVKKKKNEFVHCSKQESAG
jgi:hypothetical protein